jgi:hypothetical protein
MSLRETRHQKRAREERENAQRAEQTANAAAEAVGSKLLAVS